MIRFSAFLGLFIYAFFAVSAFANPTLTPVTLQLKWQHQFQFAGYYAAIEKGFYRDVGIDVSLLEAKPGVDSTQTVLQGGAEFGVGTSELVLNYSNGDPVLVLGVVMQHSPLALAALKSEQTFNIHQLSKYPMMIEPNSLELLAYLKHEGIDKSKIKMVTHSHQTQDLIDGKVKSMSVYTTDEPFDFVSKKIAFQLYRPIMGGIDFYGDNLFTTTGFYQRNPQLVKDFKEASFKGWQYAMQHPEEIVELIIQRYSQRKTRQHLLYEAEKMKELMVPDLVEIGHSSASRWSHIAQTYQEIGVVSKPLNINGMLYEEQIETQFNELQQQFYGLIALTALIALLFVVFFRQYQVSNLRRKQFENLFINAPVSLIELDDTGRVKNWNHWAEKTFEYLPEEILEQNVYDKIVSPDISEKVEQTVLSAQGANNLTFSENLNVTKSGKEIVCQWVNMPFQTTHNNEMRVICMARDITEQKKLTENLAKSEANFRALFESNKTVELILDAENGHIIAANQAAVDFYGYPKERLKQLNISDINVLSSTEIATEMQADQSEKLTRFDFRHKLASGEVRDVQVFSGPVVFDEKDCLYSIIHDVTEQKTVENRLKLLSEVFENAHDGIIVCNENNQIIEVNEIFTQITGYSKHEALGKNPSFLASERQDQLFYQQMWDAIKTQGHWSGELWNRKKSGEIYVVKSNISTIKNDHNEISYYISAFSDISDLKEHQQQLETLAHYDPLTKLPNRTLLADRLSAAIHHADRHQASLAVCFLDLDNFKPFNDNYGHEVGDQLLVTLSKQLKNVLRAEDTIARLGGDEFIILLNNVRDSNAVHIMANKILEQIALVPVNTQDAKPLTGSLGITLYPEDASDADTLIRHADQAMYQAKVRGRNRYQLFNMREDTEAYKKHKVISDIQKAMINEELVLYYQPKVDLQSGKLSGFEALIRWIQGDKVIMPDAFLPYIQQDETEVLLDEYVLNHAVAQLLTCHQASKFYQISINISAQSLASEHFYNRIKQHLKYNPTLDPKYLQVEILENSALDQSTNSTEMLNKIKQLGVEVAIDDFGTGYSSLGYLKNLPANLLKIDRSFISDMSGDENDDAIVEGIIQLANVFSLKTLAEGVETQAMAHKLKAMGCDYIQGYWISKPLPLAELQQFMQQHDHQACLQAIKAAAE